MPHLARILIYPLKSFDPVEVQSARALPSGALEEDRRYALFDASGKFVNGKRSPKIMPLRTTFDVAERTITVSDTSSLTPSVPHPAARQATFHVDQDRSALEAFFSERLGLPVTLRENAAAGFPDDTDAPGPTFISRATLAEVAGWYAGVTLDEARLRFRANLEIETDDPFWEDRLYREAEETVRFRVGSVEFLGTNPCQRCAVPTRSPYSGDRTADFTQTFERRRSETLPAWATRSRFNHFYRLAINTRPATNTGGTVSVGDEIVLLDPV